MAETNTPVYISFAVALLVLIIIIIYLTNNTVSTERRLEYLEKDRLDLLKLNTQYELKTEQNINLQKKLQEQISLKHKNSLARLQHIQHMRQIISKLEEEKLALEQKMKKKEKDIKHNVDLVSNNVDTSSSLREVIHSMRNRYSITFPHVPKETLDNFENHLIDYIQKLQLVNCSAVQQLYDQIVPVLDSMGNIDCSKFNLAQLKSNLSTNNKNPTFAIDIIMILAYSAKNKMCKSYNKEKTKQIIASFVNNICNDKKLYHSILKLLDSFMTIGELSLQSTSVSTNNSLIYKSKLNGNAKVGMSAATFMSALTHGESSESLTDNEYVSGPRISKKMYN